MKRQKNTAKNDVDKKPNNLFQTGMIIICLFAIASTIISIAVRENLNHTTSLIYTQPYQMTNSIWEIRTSVYEMELRLTRLSMYDDETTISYVEDAVNSIYVQIEERLSKIDKYEIPEMYITDLGEAIRALRVHQDILFSISRLKGIKDATEYYQTNIQKEYDNIYKLISNTKEYASNAMGLLVSEAQASSAFSTVISILLSLTLILFSIYFTKEVNKRNKNIYKREKILNMMGENINDIFTIFDLESRRIEFTSANINKILGLTVDEFEGKFENNTLAIPEELKKEITYLRTGGALNDIMEREITLQNPLTNEFKYLLLTIYPIREKDEITMYLAFVFDQTKAKETEIALRDALNVAQNANLAKRDFLSRMSHEIRTPMNAIIGMASIASVSLESKEKVADCLSKISNSSKHLLVLINDVLDMSKIESGKMTVSDEPFSLPELIGSITSLMYPVALNKNVAFDVLTEGITEENIIGDQLRLNQILINLLSNAIKFTPEGGFVRFEIKQLKTNNNRVCLQFNVIDNGIGMDEKFLERHFAPFEQATSYISKKYGGTGLGMSITINLINMMGGMLDVKSKPGAGSTFTVELEFSIDKKTYGQSADLSAFKGISILVVDDDPCTCEHILLLLRKFGITSESLTSGNETIERIKFLHEQGKCYDICLIDWKMPDKDGIETVREIRGIVGKDTLLIIISAYDWSSIESEARTAGVNDFINKPLFQSTLYNMLVKVLRNNKSTDTEKNTEKEPHEYDFSGKRVLVAEDNEINMMIATELLEMANFHVEPALDGADAFAKFNASPSGYYSAILMDVQMPEMDGYEATKKIRSSTHADAKIIPIIAMTANAFNDDINEAISAGMNEHVAKPINIELLYAALDKYVNLS